jgi:hypothetical protein
MELVAAPGPITAIRLEWTDHVSLVPKQRHPCLPASGGLHSILQACTNVPFSTVSEAILVRPYSASSSARPAPKVVKIRRDWTLEYPSGALGAERAVRDLRHWRLVSD